MPRRPAISRIGIHVRALAKEMHRNDRLGPGRDGFFQQAGIQVVSRLFNVHKNRPRPAKADRLGRGHEGAGDGDDLIVRPHPQRQQRKPEGVGPVAHAHGMGRPAIGGKFLFKFGDKRAAGKGARVYHRADGGIQLFADRFVMGFEIKEWNFHRVGFLRLVCLARSPAFSVFLPAVQHADDSGGVSGHDGIGGNIAGDHAARANDRAPAHRDPAQKGRAGPDGGAALHPRRNALPIRLGLQSSAFVGGAGVEIVDEGDVVPHENIVLQNHPFANEGVAGDFAAMADARAFLNLNKGSNLYVIANLAAV